MSSFDFRGLKPSSNNPLAEAVVKLQQQVARNMVKDQVSFVDSDNEDLYTDGIDVESVIKYHSDLSPTHQFNFRTDYYPPAEPDNTTVKCMLKGWNTGNEISDESGFQNHAEIWGDPTLVNGVLDLGIWNGTNSVKSIAMRLNRPTSGLENQEYLLVPDSSSMKISDCAIGFSEHIRFKIFNLAQQHSKNRTILVKRDDITATPNDGRLVMVDTAGKIIFVVRDGGVTYAKQTDANALDLLSNPTGNDMYELWVTYDASTHAQHVYVGYYSDINDWADLALSNYAGTITWPEATDTDLNLFRRHDDTDGGYLYGDFYTYRFYKEKILSSTDVTRHFTNKWTIANIAFGKVMISGYWATYQDTSGATNIQSFDSISFDPSSFAV